MSNPCAPVRFNFIYSVLKADTAGGRLYGWCILQSLHLRIEDLTRLEKLVRLGGATILDPFLPFGELFPLGIYSPED
jgi:hypothetical protein